MMFGMVTSIEELKELLRLKKEAFIAPESVDSSFLKQIEDIYGEDCHHLNRDDGNSLLWVRSA